MPEFDLQKLRYVIVQYKIPMAFDVLNCMNQSDKGDPFIVARNHVPVKIHIERIYGYRFKDEGIQLAPFSKMKEDRGGVLSHSRVQIWFDHRTFNSDMIDKSIIQIQPNQFVDLSIEYLNKFIRAYRVVTNEYWLRPLTRTDIVNFQYVLLDSEGNNQIIHQLLSHPVKFNGGKEFKLSKKSEQRLRRLILTNHSNFEREILLNINDNFRLGYYNLALTQSVTWFERFVYSSLKDRLSKTKLDKIKKKADCGCMVGISEVCKRGLNEAFGIDFASTHEFKELKNLALTHRNLIVHGEQIEEIDKRTCEQSIKAVQNAVDYLWVNVFSAQGSGQ